VDNASNLSRGDLIEAYGIPEQTTISNISGSTLTLSSALTQIIPVGTSLYIGSISKPSSCVLPSAISPILDLGSPIAPIDLSCHYAFPQVYLTPPIYNAPQTFVACEDFSATVDISLRNAITGNITASPTSSPHCGLAITGLLDVNTCANFTATSNITFSGAAQNSSLTLTARGQPDCGVDISGNIDVQACSGFTSTVKFDVPDAMAGSVFSVTPRGAADCGLDLDLKLNLNACEKITPIINFTYPEAMAGSTATFSSSQNPPDCPIELDLNLALNACTTFTASGGVSVSGGAGASGYISARATSAPNCGVVIGGNINIPDACGDFQVTNNLVYLNAAKNSHINIASIGGPPNCGINMTGTIDVPCPSVTDGKFEPKGACEGKIILSSIFSGTNCQLKLTDSTFKVKACKTVTLNTSQYLYRNLASLGQNSLAITQTLAPDDTGLCKFDLIGKLDIPCPSIQPAQITWGALFSPTSTLNIVVDSTRCNLLKLVGNFAMLGSWKTLTVCENGATKSINVWTQ
jgi:hypothetical protein